MIDVKDESERIGKLGGAWQSIEREVITLCARVEAEAREEAARVVEEQARTTPLMGADECAAAIRRSKRSEG